VDPLGSRGERRWLWRAPWCFVCSHLLLTPHLTAWVLMSTGGGRPLALSAAFASGLAPQQRRLVSAAGAVGPPMVPDELAGMRALAARALHCGGFGANEALPLAAAHLLPIGCCCYCSNPEAEVVVQLRCCKFDPNYPPWRPIPMINKESAPQTPYPPRPVHMHMHMHMHLSAQVHSGDYVGVPLRASLPSASVAADPALAPLFGCAETLVVVTGVVLLLPPWPTHILPFSPLDGVPGSTQPVFIPTRKTRLRWLVLNLSL